jgi:hypothetical protein
MFRAALARPLRSQLSKPLASRAFAEIPIKEVASVSRWHVGNEENAMKTDALVEEFKAGVAGKDGYLKTVRTVCKSEWAYELAVVFKDLDSFKAFAGAGGVTSLVDKAKPFMTDPEKVYGGARVYDEK